MWLLIIALFTGGAGVDRYDDGRTDTAIFLFVITGLLVIGGIIEYLRD